MKPLRLLAVLVALAAGLPLAAQDTARVTVQVRSGAAPVAEATVRSGALVHATDAQGRAVLALPAGPREVAVSKPGFARAAVSLTVRAGADTMVAVELEEEAEELEAIVVTSTRTGQRIEDEPTRVEVLGREEVEEKMLMTPGDVAIMWN